MPPIQGRQNNRGMSDQLATAMTTLIETHLGSACLSLLTQQLLIPHSPAAVEGASDQLQPLAENEALRDVHEPGGFSKAICQACSAGTPGKHRWTPCSSRGPLTKLAIRLNVAASPGVSSETHCYRTASGR